MISNKKEVDVKSRHITERIIMTARLLINEVRGEVPKILSILKRQMEA